MRMAPLFPTDQRDDEEAVLFDRRLQFGGRGVSLFTTVAAVAGVDERAKPWDATVQTAADEFVRRAGAVGDVLLCAGLEARRPAAARDVPQAGESDPIAGVRSLGIENEPSAEAGR